jgi:hypothetical protein
MDDEPVVPRLPRMEANVTCHLSAEQVIQGKGDAAIDSFDVAAGGLNCGLS